MAKVKGSKQYDMVVVPHRPLLFWVAISICLIVGLTVSAWALHRHGMTEGFALHDETLRELDQAYENLTIASEQVQVMEQEMANLKISQQIDSTALEDARREIATLQENITNQNEEIGFYRRVMAPELTEKALLIESLDLEFRAPGRVRYSLLLIRRGDRRKFVEGQVEISVLGAENNQEKMLPFNELDDQKKAKIDFKFRYFQDLIGEMLIPEGFEPKELTVIAIVNGPRPEQVEKRFDWVPEGG